jgi:hypothetical protein
MALRIPGKLYWMPKGAVLAIVVGFWELGCQLSNCHRHNIGCRASDAQGHIYLTCRGQRTRQRHVDLVEPGEIRVCAGKRNRKFERANPCSHLGQGVT